MTPTEKDALLYAKTGKSEKLAECLGRGISPNFEDLLFYAAKNGHLQAVELLLGKGADPNGANQRDTAGSGPLHYAAGAGHLQVVEKLLAAGADPDAKNDEGGTPLAYAIEKDHTEVIRILKAVTFTGISYSIDEALRLQNPLDGYYTLRRVILKDWHRGCSPAEMRVLSLYAFFTFGRPNGIDDMLWQGGLWSITSGIELFEAIDEPGCASFLRESMAVIREQCARSGLDLTADIGTRLEFDEQAKTRLEVIWQQLMRQDFDDEDLCARTLAYVARNRQLFTAAGPGPGMP